MRGKQIEQHSTKWVVREAVVSYTRRHADGERVMSSGVANHLMRTVPGLRHVPSAAVEHFVVFGLNARNHVVSYEIVAKGEQSACPVTACNVFRTLILIGATATLLVHNHPSGELAPSSEDIAVTTRLRQAGTLLGVPVVDHVIVTDAGYYSFLDNGLW
jgi:DNA repair protein RadC